MPKSQDVPVPRYLFRKWWTEGKLTESEHIKFYIMGKLLKIIKENKDSPGFNPDFKHKI